MQEKTEEERARGYLLYLLRRRDYFSKELREKMKRKKFSDEVIEKTVALCIARGYVDDARRTRSVIARENGKGRGPKRIALLLKTKGALTQEALADLGAFDQKAAILALLPKFKKRYPEREKLIMALLRRGFDLHSVLFCIDQKSYI